MGAWQELSVDEYDQVWDRFEARFHFHPSAHAKDWPGIIEPAPSATYTFEFPIAPADVEQLEDAALAAFRQCTAPDEHMFALDWQHPGYRLTPHVPFDEWHVPVLPDGDYYIFLGRDLAWGWFGHPWEQTICVFGANLLEAFEPPRFLRDPIRQK